MCFIVARLRAFPCGIGTSGTTRPCTHRRIRQQSYESTQEPARHIATKTESFFSIELSSAQNAGERNKTARPSQQTRELFSIFSPTPLVAASSNSFAPHCGSHSRLRACTRIQPFFDYCLHRSPPPPYFSQYVTIRGEGFAFVRSSASSPEKSNRLIDFSAAKPLRFGGSTGVNFCIFPSSPESSPVSH